MAGVSTKQTLRQPGRTREGMTLLTAGRFRMGSDRFYSEEAPARAMSVEAFFIDTYPVTNWEFARFVNETGYVTIAERRLDPQNFPGTPADMLKPGALVFKPAKRPVTADRQEAWWIYKPGAQWRRPEARSDVLLERGDHPVTCIAYEDARAYAQWAGKTLPTEAQWEYAARGGLDGADYAWGDEFMPGGKRVANTWRGDQFPYDPQRIGRSYRTTAVGSYPQNGYGLYDMIGNVWEWTQDWYRTSSTQPIKQGCCAHPPADAYDPAMPDVRIPRKVLKGGSFLCAPNACARYRPAARHPQMIDTASVHIGFRCVASHPDRADP